MKKSVAILYRLAEGARVSKRLTELLRRHNFIITTDVQNADIIIAHSDGVYFVPKKSKVKKVLLVGASLGFKRGIFQIQSRKVKLDFKYAVKTKQKAYWGSKSVWNAFYLLTQIPYALAMKKHAFEYKTLLPEIESAEVFVITYKNDPWSGDTNADEKQRFPYYKYIMINGVHDDLWFNPEKYLKYVM